MKVNFISIADVPMASFRYHIVLPGKKLEEFGHTVVITKVPTEADVYVFSKHLRYEEHSMLLDLKAKGKKTVFHVCDNHFITKHKDHYMKMIKSSDLVITTTSTLKGIIKEETGVDSELIPDGCEWPEEKPVFNKSGKLKLLWYGHISNLFGLSSIIDKLEGNKLKICTYIPSDSEIKIPPQLYVNYSFPNLEMCFEWCDAVIIPVKKNGIKVVKSHNRLTEAVRMGKFVIASDIEAYKEFYPWMWIGDVVEGIKWLEKQGPLGITERIRLAQDHINKNYNREKIGKLWETALMKLN